ncbi:protein CURVATURE THYLAKOID 1B, chloroplastic [Dorcoceras hygrometricum]|uniref:Protein CURVATURE THYLAKOID 1B, chloroplastic n=1 Tax=Dorcoceras hygrometricum TaxID=472368 RepID=A0A2Z7D1Z1_9LAMI|nr:protein CURVATURE THYLAKOID 1B, chloroplastic [Dorcoceras hygrometricum]
MASTTSTPLSISSSSALIDAKAPPRHQSAAAASSQCVHLPNLHALPTAAVHSPTRLAKTTAYCRKIARNVVAMATGDPPADAVILAETPEIIKNIQAAWDKVEDKYAVVSLGVAGVVALWGSAGMISAIDKLPVVPGLLELVGIGYTGWYAYKNLATKPDREVFVQKIKDTYHGIIGTSS